MRILRRYKKMKKRFIALLLAGVMILALAACGSTSGGGGATTAAPAPEVTTAAPAETDATDAPAGDTIEIAYGDYEGIQALAKQASNFEVAEGTVAKIDGIFSEGISVPSIMEADGTGSKFGLNMYIDGDAELPEDGTDVEVTGTFKKGDMFMEFHVNPEDIIVKDAPEGSADSESGIGLGILIEEDDSMVNTYSLLAVNPESPWVDADGNSVDAATVTTNTAGADALINWFLSDEGIEAAANYGYDDYGEYLFYILATAPSSDAEIPEATDETKTIRLSTTTSVNDSGLLGYLLPQFEEKYGYTVEVTSAGTGKAIANAKMGNADLLLVHAKAQEETFIADGFARIVDGQESERLSYMYNYFVLCGPEDDPADVKSAADVKAAFKAIADGKFLFVSRGDKSGTHTKELSLWPEDLGITDEAATFEQYADWYISANAGMGVCLSMANEQGAYILSDKATFLTFKANGGILE